MNTIFLYVLQSTLCLSLFYGLYLLLLRRETFFRFNRSVLLAIMISSMAIPLIRVPVAEPSLVQLPVMQLEEMIMFTSIETTPTIIPETENQVLQTPVTPVRATFNMIPLMYFAGFFVSLALALVSLISVARIIVTARPVVYRQQRILVSPFQISSFTFAEWIVLSEMDYERFAAEIVTHETIHRRNGHFWDLCLVNAIAIVQWFNPLAWLLRREVKILHEYETDRRTLTQGIDATRYQLLLIEKAAGASRYSVASSFAQSKIKKRIIMMNKQNPNSWARWKALLFIPLAALLMQCFACPEINRELEQISTLKSTEILQENIVWNEEKFLEELRKLLPSGVSRELSYEETWKEIVKICQLEQFIFAIPPIGKDVEQKATLPTGILIMMNLRGEMLVTSEENRPEFAKMEDIPDLMAKNLAKKGKPTYPIIIDGKEVDKINRFTLIQRDANTPADDYQKLYQTVGEAYMQKRDEIARQYYKIGYNALDAEKKAVINNVAPILVMIEVRGPLGRTTPNQAQLPNEEFRVETRPLPIAKIAGKNGGVIEKRVFQAHLGILAELDNYPIEVRYRITQFDMIVSTPEAEKTERSESAAFTDRQKALMNDLSEGQKVFFTNIKAIGPDGEIDLADMSFTII